jgi:hypothetical protein
MVPMGEMVHNTLERNYENETNMMENKVVHTSLERDNNEETPTTYVWSTSVARPFAQQKRIGANQERRGQHQSHNITRYMMPRGRNNGKRRRSN